MYSALQVFGQWYSFCSFLTPAHWILNEAMNNEAKMQSPFIFIVTFFILISTTVQLR